MYKSFAIPSKELLSLHDHTASQKYQKKEDQERTHVDQVLEKTLRLSQDIGSKFNAADVWDTCFPFVKADVFISHSGKDAKLAKQLKAALLCCFGLDAFVDSTVWGYYKTLLRRLHNKYCLPKNSDSYDYEKAVTMANHVHAMLSYALSRMIDQTECFMFIDSANSVPERSTIDKTYSPWIFHELATVHVIERRTPARLAEMVNMSSTGLIKEATELPLVGYPVFREKLIYLTWGDMKNWHVQHTSYPQEHALDGLYRITSLCKPGCII